MEAEYKYDLAAEAFWSLAIGAFAGWLIYKQYGAGPAFSAGIVVALLIKIQHDLGALRQQSRMANFYLEKLFDQATSLPRR